MITRSFPQVIISTEEASLPAQNPYICSVFPMQSSLYMVPVRLCGCTCCARREFGAAVSEQGHSMCNRI